MITKWKLANFKSIQNETKLDFAPLTIFAGTNSSGKSTLLQSILLISQTLLDKDPTSQVVLNGEFIELGEFSDIKSTDGVSDQIIIGWELKPLKDNISDGRFDVEQVSSISCEIAFGMDDSKPSPMLSSIALSVQKHITDNKAYECSLVTARATEETTEYKRKLIANPSSEEVLSTLDYDVKLGRASSQCSGDFGDIIDRETLYRLYVLELADYVRLAESSDLSLTDYPGHTYGRIYQKEVLYRSETIGCSFWHFLPELITSLVETEVERIEAIRNMISPEIYPFKFLDGALSPKIKSCIQDIVIGIDEIIYVYDTANTVIRPSLDVLKGYLLGFLDSENVSLWVLLDDLTDIYKYPSWFREEVMKKLYDSQKFQALLDEMIQDVRRNGDVGLKLLQIKSSEDNGYLKFFFTNSVRYIGPLRIDPESSYPIFPSSFLEDVGLAGENTAAVFESQKMREIQYLPTECFSNSANIPVPVTCSLKDAVVDWLGYLGVAQNIESKASDQLGHELQVCMSSRNKSHDLTQVGVGVSQVLPIIVAGLLAKPDTTLIIEQPELHLHPKVQSLLADFFLSLTQLGKQCLVETHSEHIINRIRLRIAKGTKSSPWQKATKVYFVEKKESGSSFREVSINEYGAIQDWPVGFFEEGLLETEKRIRAMALKQHVKGRYN